MYNIIITIKLISVILCAASESVWPVPAFNEEFEPAAQGTTTKYYYVYFDS